MNSIADNVTYLARLGDIAKIDLPWHKLDGKTILVLGATGLVGSCIIDLVMYRNKMYKANINVVAVTRNKNRAMLRFEKYWNLPTFKYLELDCNNLFPKSIGFVDFAIHAASNTHPVAYSTDPVGTITTNVFGTYNLLEYLRQYNACCRVLFLSSVEIYGENLTNKEYFTENDLGYINCNTMRAGYPESKRVSESLCQAYIDKYNMDIVMARLCRVFGPTMLESDSKALAQFINKAVNHQDIILKSEGKQFYSYIYVIDAVSAIFSVLLNGKCGEAYNVADAKSNISLKDLAETIASYVSRKVIYDVPDEKEKKGYSTATKAVLDATKLHQLGWCALRSIRDNIKECIDILIKMQEV